MKKIMILFAFTLMLTATAISQQGDKPAAMVFENQYIMPKSGMEDKFEAAIKAHDDKFHPDGPYKAGLRKVDYGEKAGWYVWVFGPVTYEGLDSRPAKENGHNEDWGKTIDPLVQEYGELTLSELNHDLSFGLDIMKSSPKYELWIVDLKKGQYYRFKALAEKLKKAYESTGKTAFLVYNNLVHTNNGFDVALLWSFKNFSDWANDPGPKEAVEKLYGSGSWQNLLDEWQEITEGYTTEIRSKVN